MAIKLACCTATGRPSCREAIIDTPLPTLLITGALIKIAWYGVSSKPVISNSCSKLSICRPKALRCTPMSIISNGTGSFSVISLAIMIIPAHVPHNGLPSVASFLIGCLKSYLVSSRLRVVLSPPGMISPSTSESCSGSLISRHSTPRVWSILICSMKSPWIARTPINKFV